MQARARNDYRHALAQFATGVTVITTRTSDGVPTGLTVNSFNSVSLQPPLVLWSLSLKAGALAAFRDCAKYAINMLASHQLDVAKRFATRGVDRFVGTQWHSGPHDLPLINGAVATLIANNRSQHVEGDHVILIGEVTQFDVPGGPPLVFHDGRYIASATEEPLPRAFRKPWR
ncbi:MAG: flavin reductase family protein [Pseudomonadota bacterium]|nr:flavin reductase family protein [Pseudomonadota bacterium]